MRSRHLFRPADVVRIVDRFAGGGDPVAQLDSIRELEEAVARYRGRVLRDVIAGGMTVAAVADRLGVTRQAIYQRLRAIEEEDTK